MRLPGQEGSAGRRRAQHRKRTQSHSDGGRGPVLTPASNICVTLRWCGPMLWYSPSLNGGICTIFRSLSLRASNSFEVSLTLRRDARYAYGIHPRHPACLSPAVAKERLGKPDYEKQTRFYLRCFPGANIRWLPKPSELPEFIILPDTLFWPNFKAASVMQSQNA